MSSRLKREDCKHTKHDPCFSKWEILVGHSDWENYSLGKDGAQRYRVHKLPECCSHPGLYELGVAVSHTDSGRKISKLNPSCVIPVYLGQADNVRTRLQEHGRGSSHLGHCDSSAEHGLFTDIFSGGYPIVFRWALMENKKEAEKAEARLLEVFDYAWNKGGNGARRPNDILLKLDRSDSAFGQLSHLLKPFDVLKWSVFSQKREGIKINSCMKDMDSNLNHHEQVIGSRVFTFSKLPPRLVSEKCVVNDNDYICGVPLGDGSICRSWPVKGRKRCNQHIGMRIPGSSSRLSQPLEKEEKYAGEDYITCGVALGDGSVCKSRPIKGRKRCNEHKGMKVNGSLSMLFLPKEVEGKHVNEDCAACGIALGNGSVYKTRPIGGSKRCCEHGGMVNEPFSNTILPKEEPTENYVCKDYTPCGVALGNGSVCRSRPVEGRKRCSKHRGMRASVILSTLTVIHKEGLVKKGTLGVCGVGLGDGSLCMESPFPGRKRCELHKGRRATITA